MQIGNLERAREIAETLPVLTRARAYLSRDDATLLIGGDVMPKDMKYRVVHALNLEINSLQDEVGRL